MEKVFINSYRKASQILLFSLISLALLVVSAFAARQLFQSWYSLAAGIFLMALAIPFHILGKRISSLYIISFLMNSVAAGFSVCTYYIVKNYPLNLETMMLAVFPAAGMLFLTVICFPPLFKSKKNNCRRFCCARHIIYLSFNPVLGQNPTSLLQHEFLFISIGFVLHWCVFRFHRPLKPKHFAGYFIRQLRFFHYSGDRCIGSFVGGRSIGRCCAGY